MKIKNEINFNHNRYIPVTNWNDYHIWPPKGGIRYLIFNKNKNGFDKVVKKVGKRVLIDEAAFFEWVANQGKGA
ncbi:TPA: hypothetical protein JAN72_06555 [Legionella pneumophila]|jgi:hypothetical protein|uniref:Uncharacterized protein n=1 Tax=Legionella pneumophila TaxID=446 RepID=A0AAN5KSS8_LEGPN|nr:hypothetical protein [Legionella pneumophila]HAT1972303.1 hypothetical protein [Legionella pneumophila]HAT6956422.1 hypothetical protein [Legionella pneumophila]HEN4771752.1 hypothetical protein [Legionella pneumophila]